MVGERVGMAEKTGKTEQRTLEGFLLEAIHSSANVIEDKLSLIYADVDSISEILPSIVKRLENIEQEIKDLRSGKKWSRM